MNAMRWFTWMALSVGLATGFRSPPPVTAVQDPDDESAQVVRYLDGLGLNQRVVDYFEQQIATHPDAATRQAFAERLAVLYTEQILAAGNGPQEMEQWQQRAANLIALHPQLENPILRVAIFHADHFRAAKRLEEWWSSQQANPKTSEVAGEYRDLIRELRQYSERVQQSIEQLVELKSLSGDESDTIEAKILQNENALLHTRYLAAWANYFLAILSETEKADRLRTSEQMFREFLQIADRKPLLETDAAWFNLSSGWIVRGLIGLAANQAALGHNAESDHLFNLVRSVSAPAESLADIWKFRALIYSGQNRRAENWAENFLTAQGATDPAAWSAVAQLTLGIQEASLRERLLSKSLRGLARGLQADSIAAVLKSAAWNSKDDFLSNWILGLISLNKYSQARELSTLTDAQLKIERAIQLAGLQADPVEVSICHFLLAKVYLQKMEFDQALVSIERAKPKLIREPMLAPELQWLEIQCLISLTRLDERNANRALAAIETMIRRYPDSPMISRAEFEKMKLELIGLPPDQAIARLRTVSPQNEHYPDALFEMVRLQYKIWLSAANARLTTAAAILDQLEQWEITHREHPAATPERKLKGLLLVVDAVLRKPDANPARIEALMGEAERLANLVVDRNSTSIQEFCYYQMLAADRQGNPEQATERARWISEFARGSRYERAALVYLVNAIESGGKQTGERPLERDDYQQLIQFYRRLRELDDPSASQTAGARNLVVIRSRIADYLFLTEQWQQAEAEYESLLQDFPQQSDFLLGVARSRMKLKRFNSAVDVWRKLAAGSPAGTEPWYESKSGLIRCLVESDVDSASRILRQTRVLSPEMPAAWAARFDELESIVEKKGAKEQVE